MQLPLQTRVNASGRLKTAPAAHARMLAGNMTTTATMYRACAHTNDLLFCPEPFAKHSQVESRYSLMLKFAHEMPARVREEDAGGGNDHEDLVDAPLREPVAYVFKSVSSLIHMLTCLLRVTQKKYR